ncbi:MAG: FtsQ-type POTRA domain-containing protein [Candidatus Latescibacteria bacterium]|nr:FtsQ-type POTRA domain-containing protein [Candidatus Latescibacterota bacterium]
MTYFGGTVGTLTLRSYPRLIRRTVVVSVAAALLAAAFYYAWSWISHTTLFEVDSITVNGVHYGEIATVLAHSGLSEGQNLADADVSAASAALIDLPWIESVSVDRIWPHSVAIEVVERSPVATVSVGDNIWAVDPLGRILPPWQVGAMPDVPRIIGAWPGWSTALKDSLCHLGARIDRSAVRRAVGWVRVLEDVSPAASTEISEIDVRDSSYTALILTANGRVLKLPPSPAPSAAAAAVAALSSMSDVLNDAQAIDARVCRQVILTTG